MRRFALKLGVFLLLGALINVAVAWGCALSKSRSSSIFSRSLGHSHNAGPAWMYEVIESAGATVVRRIAIYVDAQSDVTDYVETVTKNSRWSGGLAPGWSLASNTIPAAVPSDNDPLFEFAFGWPRRAMVWECREQVPGYLDEVRWGITISGIRADGKPLIVLPFRIILGGFAIDTLLFTLVLAGPFVGFRQLRRISRARRSRCLDCGYDLRGRASENKLCPECGANASSPS